MLRECDANSFTNCVGTHRLEQEAAAKNRTNPIVQGPFPPHCVRGSPGAELYSTIVTARIGYQTQRPNAPLSLVMKGLDVTTGTQRALLLALLLISSKHQ